MKLKVFFPAILLCILCYQAAAQLHLRELKVENRVNPYGIDTQKPRFSWQLVSDKRNVLQSAYEITVQNGKQTVWSSGKVFSPQSVYVEYSGSRPMPGNCGFGITREMFHP